MKRVAIAVLALLGAANIANAQLKPEAGSVGLGFRLSGLANVAFTNWGGTALGGQTINDQLGVLPAGTTVGDLVPQEMLFGRYYLSSDLALRVGLGINSMSETMNSVDSVGGGVKAVTTTDSKTSAFSFGIGVGVEKHFASAADKIDPYAGAQLNFASLGAIKQEINSNTNTDPASSSAVTREWDGGSAFSFNLLAGFNYFFTDNFSLGAEMSWGYNSVKVGGDYSESATTTVGGTSVNSNTIGQYKSGWSGLRVGSTAGVNASVFF